jgi:hypothetical protein
LNYPINFCFNHGFSRDNEAGQANRLPFWSRIGVRGGGGILVEPTPAWSKQGAAARGSRIFWLGTTRYWCGAGRMSDRKTNALLACGLA